MTVIRTANVIFGAIFVYKSVNKLILLFLQQIKTDKKYPGVLPGQNFQNKNEKRLNEVSRPFIALRYP